MIAVKQQIDVHNELMKLWVDRLKGIVAVLPISITDAIISLVFSSIHKCEPWAPLRHTPTDFYPLYEYKFTTILHPVLRRVLQSLYVQHGRPDTIDSNPVQMDCSKYMNQFNSLPQLTGKNIKCSVCR